MDPQNIDFLQSTLRNHIVEGLIPTILIPEGTSSVTSLLGNDLTVYRDGEDIFVKTFKIVSQDQLAYNGLVHKISGVLTIPPSTDTIFEQMAAAPNAATMSAAFYTVYEKLTPPNAVTSDALFVTQLLELGLDEMLNGSGPWTLIVPSDKAIASFLSTLSHHGIIGFFDHAQWQIHKENLIRFHIAEGNFFVGDRINFAFTMMNGEDVTTTRNIDTVSFTPSLETSATSTLFDIPAVNGVVHTSPRVLTPAFLSLDIMEVVLSATPLFAQLIVEASYESDVNAGLHTVSAMSFLKQPLILAWPTHNVVMQVFAPADSALMRLGGVLDNIRSATNEDVLRVFVGYHIALGVVPSTSVKPGSSITTATLSGNDVTVHKTLGGAILIGLTQVIAPDRLAATGVVHVLNGLLEPPNLSLANVALQKPQDLPILTTSTITSGSRSCVGDLAFVTGALLGTLIVT